MEIKRLTPEMLRFRLGNDPDIDPDWFVAHLEDIIRYEPDGCFAVCDGDKVVGMLASTTYQKIGWLSWLFVLEQYRMKGLGEQLMRRGIEYLWSRGMKTILLEADPKPVSMYKRLGFQGQFHTQHYTLGRAQLKAGHRTLAAITVSTIDDMPQLATFDEEYFGQNRLGIFQEVFGNPNFRGLVARVKDEVAGYLFLTQSTQYQQVCPLVVDPSREMAEEVAGGLIREAFKVNPKPLYFRCPLVADDYADVLRELGAVEGKYNTLRMYLGDDYPPERKGIFSLGCPGKG